MSHSSLMNDILLKYKVTIHLEVYSIRSHPSNPGLIKINPDYWPTADEHEKWCNEFVGKKYQTWNRRRRRFKKLVYSFKHEKDALMFALKFK